MYSTEALPEAQKEYTTTNHAPDGRITRIHAVLFCEKPGSISVERRVCCYANRLSRRIGFLPFAPKYHFSVIASFRSTTDILSYLFGRWTINSPPMLKAMRQATRCAAFLKFLAKSSDVTVTVKSRYAPPQAFAACHPRPSGGRAEDFASCASRSCFP